MWCIVQDEWQIDGTDRARCLDAVLTKVRPGTEPRIIVLPAENHTVDDPETAKDWHTYQGLLSRNAVDHDIYLAGSVVAKHQHGTGHIGFLFGPDGSLLLSVAKTLPDLVAEYRNVASTLGASRTFEFAETPYGRIGIVVGEDILAPHLVRATALCGAEVIINPWIESSDSELEARNELKAARAYENSCYVVSTSPQTSSSKDGIRAIHALAAIVAGPDGKNILPKTPSSVSYVPIDIEGLRVRRSKVFPPNFPVYHRTHVFGEEAKHQATSAVTPAATTRADWRNEANKRAQSAPQPPKLENSSYGVLLAQTMHYNVTGAHDREEAYTRNIDNAFKVMQGFASIPTVRLAVIPEFALHGSPFGMSASQFIADVAMELPGPESERLSEFAVKNKIYIAASAYERDPNWPGRFFNSAFIINDSGDIIHRYRKIMCADLAGMIPVTTPGGIYSEYIDRYGFDGLFPVAETPLGNLATMICFDMNFSETARALVKRGAEVILHPTSEPHNAGRYGWDLGRRARALENRVYIVSAGIGGSFSSIHDTVPSYFDRGYSKVIDYRGEIAFIAEGPGQLPISGDIDIAALRRLRNDTTRNYPLWDDASAYADFYQNHPGYPSDLWLEEPIEQAGAGVHGNAKADNPLSR